MLDEHDEQLACDVDGCRCIYFDAVEDEGDDD
jgi:hypothetical protein